MCLYCEDDYDCQFEFELSLPNIRCGLIQMLNSEPRYCTCCRLFRCGCDQARLARSSTSETVYDYRVIARPVARPRPTRVSALPTNTSPRFTGLNPQPTNDVESWLRTSTPNPEKTESRGCKPIDHINQLSPPVPKSIWNDYKKTKPEVNTSSVSLTENVEEFFKSFSARMFVSGNMAYEQNQILMQQLKVMVETRKEDSEDSSSCPD